MAGIAKLNAEEASGAGAGGKPNAGAGTDAGGNEGKAMGGGAVGAGVAPNTGAVPELPKLKLGNTGGGAGAGKLILAGGWTACPCSSPWAPLLSAHSLQRWPPQRRTREGKCLKLRSATPQLREERYGHFETSQLGKPFRNAV